MNTEVSKRIEWDMGHRVPLHGSRCRNLHGHRYCADIICAAAELTPEGFVVDFGEIKRLVGGWVDKHWDHNVVMQANDPVMAEMYVANENAGLKTWYIMDNPPTAEYLAEALYWEAKRLLTDSRLRVVGVRLYETPNCWADYS